MEKSKWVFLFRCKINHFFLVYVIYFLYICKKLNYMDDEYKKITPELIDSFMKDIYEKTEPNEERKIKLLTGCKTTGGLTDLELGNICDNPECYSCSTFRKFFIDELKRRISENEL